MSKLDDLIAKLCPDGVEFKQLGDVCSFNRGTSISSQNAKNGNVPVISGGKKPAFYHNKANRFETTITIAGSGAYAGFVNIWKKPIFCADSFSVDVKDDTILNVIYLYHYLLNNQAKIYSKKTGAGIPHVHGKDIAKFLIPIPPLEIQQEIVRILDNFTKLISKLTSELASRKKQYEYYRDKLLTFGNNVDWKKISEICTRHKGTSITAGNMKKLNKPNAPIRIFAAGNTVVDVNHGDIPDKDVINESSIIVKSRGNISFEYYEKPFSHKNEMWSYSAKSKYIDLKFIYYYLLNHVSEFQKKAKTGKLPQISISDTENYLIPFPPISEQKRIVSILERFDKLCNDISEGLPAEIEARKKQYEYYRDKLLTFKETKKNEYV